MRLTELDTPCLILDETRLRRNCAAMTERMRGRGVRLRPHMKTAKSLDVARIALEGNFGGVTVATLNEAEYFAASGIDDILYSSCVTPDKLERARALARRGVRLSLVTDSRDVARALSEHATDAVFPVHVEIDSGEHRTGVEAGSAELLEIARILHGGAGTELAGVLTHAGHSYACRSADEIRAVAEEERRLVVLAAKRLAESDLPCPSISAGSTPTATHAASCEGVTEMRPGVYMFGDLAQVGLASCDDTDIAVSVLATVISHDRERGRLMLDAGALALSKDVGAHGYGIVVDVDGLSRAGELVVDEVHQEHGAVRGAVDFERHPIGSRVRVLPNHACMTAAMYDRYHVVRGTEDEILATWPRTNGWRPAR